MKKLIILLFALLCSYCVIAQDSKCVICNGSGRQRCALCGGSGMTMTYTYFGWQSFPCSFCCGTGDSTCMICSGTGHIIVNTAPVTAPIYIPNGGSSTTSQSEHNHYDESSFKPKTCMHCYGDGKCGTCLGRGSYTFFGNTVLCANCERNHSGVCSFCHGRGKIF